MAKVVVNLVLKESKQILATGFSLIIKTPTLPSTIVSFSRLIVARINQIEEESYKFDIYIRNIIIRSFNLVHVF